LKEQLLHEVRFAHRNNSLLSHSTFGALIGSPDHAVRRRPNLQLLHVFVTQLLSHVHHLITWGAARRQCGYWAVARTSVGLRTVYHFTSTTATSQFQRRAVVLSTGHRQSTGATIRHHHAAVYIKIPLFSHFLSSCGKNPPTLCVNLMYKYKGHNP